MTSDKDELLSIVVTKNKKNSSQQQQQSMMVEVPVAASSSGWWSSPEERRKKVATIIESCPFWSGIAALTVVDVVLFACQLWVATTEVARDQLETVELMISTLFVLELAVRCYASDREQLMYPANVFDGCIILANFALSLVEVTTPLVAARGARLIHYGMASTRCGRAARNTSRTAVEMRNFFNRAGKGLAARAAMRASEDDIAPLFIDVTDSRDLNATLTKRPWEEKKKRRLEDEDLPLVATPVFAAAGNLKRLAKAEIDNAASIDVTYRAKLAAKSTKDDLEQPNNANKRVVTSARALVALLEHTVAEARVKGHPPPRLLATLKADCTLVFLNREI